jgi:hypothetical protein
MNLEGIRRTELTSGTALTHVMEGLKGTFAGETGAVVGVLVDALADVVAVVVEGRSAWKNTVTLGPAS